ncbi:hypothetical protein MMYC01_208921 [Madurella mycetomatis]|uniref:Uncharacterized protein n=1 Tax=Madurella mycetomatis TaxID=100816 RepID=A0A175VU88_9PEZI|nr:hypothetical protein MMYC01_208921 [Madurella mycetomatis]
MLLLVVTADASTALVLFDTAFETAWEKLHSQVRELIAGRDWDSVENVQIGRTPDGHWVELSLSLEELPNVTMWRQMYLPLDHGVIYLLDQADARLSSEDVGWWKRR